MKKIYLFVLGVLLASGASARELTFYMGDVPVQNGTTVASDALEVEDYGDYKEVKMDPHLYLGSDIFTSDVEIKVTCLTGQYVQLCAGGNCMKGTAITKSKVKINAGQLLPLQYDFVGELDADEPVPTVTSLIEAVDTKHPETARSFTITMGGNASLSVVEIKSEFTVTSSGIVYNLDAPVQLSLYNITGKQVLSAALSGAGIVDASSLPQGVYVYKAGKHTGKMIIK